MKLISGSGLVEMLENGLVTIYATSTGENVVYGRELHEKLEAKSRYNDWIRNRLEECEAVEDLDYESFTKKIVKDGRPQTDHIIRLDIAKEMAMLERNDRGKDVRRYFIEVEKRYKKRTGDEKLISNAMFVVKFVADDLRCNEASRLLMYENMCKDLNIPTGFLPHYELNGNRQLKAPTTLLKENGCNLSAVKFNILLIKNGYLEERERPSSKGDKTKKFKALTDKGLGYGENAVNPHNQKEVQPLYYSDKFNELYDLVTE